MGFFATRDFAIRYPPLRMRDDLHPGVRGNDRERRIIEIVIGFALVLLARLPPHLDDADLRQQRVLDEGIQHDEAGILLHEDVIDVIRLLLRGGNILRPDRLEPHHLVARRKMSISAGISPSTVSATSVDTALDRPSGAGMSRDMSPR